MGLQILFDKVGPPLPNSLKDHFDCGKLVASTATARFLLQQQKAPVVDIYFSNNDYHLVHVILAITNPQNVMNSSRLSDIN